MIPLALLLLLLLPLSAEARDPKVVDAFRKTHPCPSTGKTTGACPTHVADHIIPLSLYGPDRVDNLQWQSVADGRIKDKLEYEAYHTRMRVEKKLCPK